jgi:predicted DNA-binding ribbon-helix-helix protein
LWEIADERHITLSDLITEIDAARQHANLSSAIRLFVLRYYLARLNGEIDPRADGNAGGGLAA